MADIKNIDVFQTVSSVTFQVEPNTNIININKITTESVVATTNLTYSPSATNGVVESDTGSDATIPLADTVNAGLLSPSEKIKLTGIATGAEVNVNADWNATTGDAQILNKPTIPSISGLATVTYVDAQDSLKVDKVAGSRLITSSESTILGNTSGTNTGDNATNSQYSGLAASKQDNIILTTTGTSGASTLVGATLNIPQYSGATNLTTSQTSTNFTINSSTGDDASVPLGNGTLAGATLNDYTSAEKTKLASISGTNTGDQNLQTVTNGAGNNTTTNSITANSFIKSGGTSSQILAADGSVITQGNNITITGGVISSVGGTGGGGATVNYYLNGGTSQGDFGGTTYYEFSKTAVIGTGADFNRNTNGYIASFITDVADPSLLLIPAGNWNLEFFFSSSSAGGSPSFYTELYKYDVTTFTLIASGSANPEGITNGTAIDAYFTALVVPETVLTVNDRLAIRVYVNASSKTITLHTQNGHLCEVITTFSTGLTALNGLQTQVQNLAVGTSGTDFNIQSGGSIHTFNLPDASGSNRGALSSANWTTFNGKQDALGFTPYNATNPSGYQTATQVQTIADAKVVQTITNGVTTTAPSQDAVFDALALKQPLATVLTNTTASYTTAEQTKLGQYPSTATNGKILQGNGTTYVEIDTPTGTTNLNYTPAVSNGTVTSSTGSSATIPLANGTNAGLMTAAEKTKIAGAALLASPTFTGTPSSPTPPISNNSTRLATTEYVDRQVNLGEPNNITIGDGTATNLTTETLSNTGGYGQYGKNVMVNNGANAINITVNIASPADFIASYTKLGIGIITFVQGAGATLKGFPFGAEVTVINGVAGSTALLTRTGNTFYLQVNNLL